MPGVKAGDLAISKNCVMSGRLFEIIELAPQQRFLLPNGQPHSKPKHNPAWVVRCLSGPHLTKFTDGNKLPVSLGVAADKYLFPLPGDPVEVDSEQTVEAT